MRRLSLGLALIVLFLISGTSGHQQVRRDVPYVPTPYVVVDEMLKMVDVKETDLLYDLGCGDGRIVIAAASQYGTRGIGIDIDPERIAECHANAEESQVEKLVTFRQQNLFETDFSEASVLTLYLLSSVNLKLRPKILSELKPGTRVVSHDFSMGEWNADQKKDVMVDNDLHFVYFWIVPANVSGTWKVSLPSELSPKDLTMQIKQKFQQIDGRMGIAKSSMALQDPQLEADRISFQIIRDKTHSWSFEGTAKGHFLEGQVRIVGDNGNKTAGWKARRDPATVKPIDPGNSENPLYDRDYR